jgi:hypothetical protein
MMKIKVECHSGYKANERPVRFYIGERALEVKELLDRWYGEDHDYFKLLASDANTYILKYDRFEDQWQLSLYSSLNLSPRAEGEVIDFGEAQKSRRNQSFH